MEAYLPKIRDFHNNYIQYTQGDDNTRQMAERNLIRYFQSDLEYFKVLEFIYLTNRTSLSEKKFALIAMNCILKLNSVEALWKYFNPFLTSITKLINHTLNLIPTHPEIYSMFSLIAALLLGIALKTNFHFSVFNHLLEIYTKKPYALPLSFEAVQFYFNCEGSENEAIKAFLQKTQPLVERHFFNIINLCLNCPYTEIQFKAIDLFASKSSFFSGTDENFQTCTILLNKATSLFQDVANVNDLFIQQFWSKITDLDSAYAEPFFTLAKNVLETAEFESVLAVETKTTLLSFMISKHRFIKLDMVESIVELYFSYLVHIDPDPSFRLFQNFITIPDTYYIFKNVINKFLFSKNSRLIFIAVFHLQELIDSFSKIITNDKEYIINVCKEVHKLSPDIANCAVRALSSLSFCTSFNPSEMMEIMAILKTVSELMNDIITKGYILKTFYNIGSNNYSSMLFDRLFEMNAYFTSTNTAMYLNALNSYCHEINMTESKYDLLYQIVVRCWQQTISELEQLQINEESCQQNRNVIYSLKEILSNCAIFLINLYTFRPSMLIQFVGPAISVIVQDMSEETTHQEEDDDTPDEIRTSPSFEFNKIIEFGKGILAEHVRPFYPKIAEIKYGIMTQSIIMKIDSDNCPFQEIFQNIAKNCIDSNFTVTKTNFYDFIDYMLNIHRFTPGMFVIDNQELLLGLICKVESLMPSIILSPELFFYATLFLRSFIKPSNIKKMKNREWYPNIINKAGAVIESWAIYLSNLPNVETFSMGTVIIMFSLLNMKHRLCNEFFVEIFYKQLYLSNSKYYANNLISILIKLVEYEAVGSEIINNIIAEFTSHDFDDLSIRDEFICFLITLIRKVPQKAVEMHDWIKKEWQSIPPDNKYYQAGIANLLLLAYNNIPSEFSFVAENIIMILSSFSLVPSQYFAKDILLFFEAHKNELSLDIVNCLIAQLIKYFGYQDFARYFFGISLNKHNKLLQMLKQLLSIYPYDQIIAIVKEILSNQPTSVTYLLQIIQ